MLKVESNLTMENLKKLEMNPINNNIDLEENELKIEEGAKKWLLNNLNIDANSIFSHQKQHNNVNFKEEDNQKWFGNSLPIRDDILFESVSQKDYKSKLGMEKQKSSLKKPALIFEIALKKIRFWIRQKFSNPFDVLYFILIQLIFII